MWGFIFVKTPVDRSFFTRQVMMFVGPQVLIGNIFVSLLCGDVCNAASVRCSLHLQ